MTLPRRGSAAAIAKKRTHNFTFDALTDGDTSPPWPKRRFVDNDEDDHQLNAVTVLGNHSLLANNRGPTNEAVQIRNQS